MTPEEKSFCQYLNSINSDIIEVKGLSVSLLGSPALKSQCLYYVLETPYSLLEPKQIDSGSVAKEERAERLVGMIFNLLARLLRLARHDSQKSRKLFETLLNLEKEFQ